MKKLLSIILTVSMLMTMLVVVPLTANANEKDVAATGAISGTTGDCTWKIEGTVLTISGNGEMGIGQDSKHGTGMGIGGLGTVKWQPWCCGDVDYSQTITEIIIENGVTGIADFAFFDSPNLVGITIPDSVTSLGKGALYDCNKLSSAVVPDSVTSISASVFSGCSGLKSVTIGKSVKSIGNSAFSGCSGLTHIDIPASVETIGGSAFYNTSLTSVTIPATVTDIYTQAFGYYYNSGFGVTKVKDFTVYGYSGSDAQRYANDNNFIFVALDDEPLDPTKTTKRDVFGDIDGDGEVTIVDTTFLQRYSVGLTTPYPIGEPME